MTVTNSVKLKSNIKNTPLLVQICRGMWQSKVKEVRLVDKVQSSRRQSIGGMDQKCSIPVKLSFTKSTRMYREDAMASQKPRYKPKTVIIKLIKPKKTVKDENTVID